MNPTPRDFSIRLERRIDGGPGTYGHVEYRFGIFDEARRHFTEVGTNEARLMLRALLDYDRAHMVLDAVAFDGAAYRVTNITPDPARGIATSL